MSVSTKKVYVVNSRTVSNGDETPEEYGSGGIFWFPPETSLKDALEAFEREAKCFASDEARIRLVQVEVPGSLDGEALTEYLDSDDLLDLIEVTALPIAERRTFSVRH